MPEAAPLVVRRLLLLTIVVGLLGTGVELLLLEHTEDIWQLTPLALILVALMALPWLAARGGGALTRVFQMTMLIFVVNGIAGAWLHYRGNVEFELELHRTLAGFELFRAAIAGATPALAPGTMIVLGLVGLTYTLTLRN